MIFKYIRITENTKTNECDICMMQENPKPEKPK